MNIVNKLTLSHLKANKNRTIITTLGICVSVAMITAVFVAVASFVNFVGNASLLSNGNKHAVYEVNYQQLQELKDDSRISRVGVNVEGDNSSFQLANRKSYHSGTGDIYFGDLVNLEQLFTGEYEGTIPQNDNEIAVEQSLIDKNELDWKVGDEVNIPIGYRYIIDNDEESVVSGTYFSSEQFKQSEVKQYTITAILHDNPPTSLGYSIICGVDIDNLSLSPNDIVNATVELKEVNYNSLNTISDIASDYKIENYEANTTYLQTKFAIDKNSNLMTSIIPMSIIILVIIMIASVVLIYNAFGMSLSERVRYLGMLTSVGATKTQKKASVYFEGAILGAVGIPVGILAGVVGIGITLKLVGKRIIQTGMILGVSDFNINMDVVVPIWALIGIIIFSVLTILISSFVPAYKASSITAIDAIRQSNEIKVKAKRLKSPKIVRKVFGYEGELAHKNLKRNGRKAKIITASIALSIILFLSCNYFCQLFVQSIDFEVDLPYQVVTAVEYDKKDDFIENLRNINCVDDCYGVNCAWQSGDFSTIFAKEGCLTDTYKNLFNSSKYVYVNYLDDDDFNQLCQNNGIDYNQFYGSTVKALVMNNVNHKSGGADVFTDNLLGVQYDTGQGKVELAGFVNYDSKYYACNLNPANTISLYVPYSIFNSLLNSSPSSDWNYDIGVVTDQHEQVAEDITTMIEDNGYNTAYVNDYIESFETIQTFIFVLQVFVYGFIVLITLITIANIINTISTGIALRRKEFAMLKSVGTTPKGFVKMISLESAFYGIKAVAFGIPISLLISLALNKVLSSDVIPFQINWLLYLGVILVVFVIISLSMFYSVSKLKNDSIVETLKEDIS